METVVLIKFFIGLFFLLWASRLDLKSRTVPNRIWKLFILFMAPLTLYEALFEYHSILEFIIGLFQLFFVSGLALAFYYLGFYGGADAKALIVLSILFPFYPEFGSFPVLFRGLSFSFSTLANSVIFAPLFALYFFATNLVREGFGELKETPLYYFIGRKVSADQIPPHHSLLEFFDEDGRLVRVRRGVEPDERMINALKNAKKRGELGRVWATPQIPFIVFITIGYTVSFILGDVLSFVILSLFPNP